MERINCDVFMKDESTIDLYNEVICITGNFYGGKNCSVTTAIIADGDVVFEDGSSAVAICAGGKVCIGKYSRAASICSDEYVFIDDLSYAKHVFAKKDISLGYAVSVYSATTDEDVLCDYYQRPKTFLDKLIDKIDNFLSKI